VHLGTITARLVDLRADHREMTLSFSLLRLLCEFGKRGKRWPAGGDGWNGLERGKEKKKKKKKKRKEKKENGRSEKKRHRKARNRNLFEAIRRAMDFRRGEATGAFDYKTYIDPTRSDLDLQRIARLRRMTDRDGGFDSVRACERLLNVRAKAKDSL